MATVHCPTCGTELAPHCEHGRCDWLVCRERECEAKVYDVHRGLLLRKDLSVVAWDEA